MEYEVDIKLEKQSPIDVELRLETAGITEHNLLKNRNLPDQHPISAITGLQDALDTIPTDYVSDVELESALLEKQDVISDLATIRSNAALGATAVQPNDLSGYATQTWVENKGYLTEIPVEYVTYSELTAKGYQTAEDVENVITAKNYTTMSAVEAKGYITDSALVGYATENYVDAEFVPQSRTINGKSLSENINLTASDIGATTQAYVNAGLSTKQNIISDLADIRSGAELGSTALQNITSRMVVNALGFVPYNSSNPNKYVNETDLTTKQDRLIEGEGIILDNATNKATGIGSVSFANAISDGIVSVELSGLCEQKTTPTPLNPIPVLCNNGEILFRYNGDVLEMYVSGTTEKVKDSLNNIVTAENLLGLGNYQDMQDIISGKVSRKIVVQALDGTERWNTGVNNNNIRYYYMSLSSEAHYENLVMLSNCYNEVRLPVAQFDDFSCTIRSSRTIYITDNRFNDTDGFSSFLAEQYANGTPVYIVLALLEPIIETVSQQQLTTQRGNNTISIFQGDISNLALSVTYKTNNVLISVDNNNYVSKSVFDAEIARLEALIKG